MSIMSEVHTESIEKRGSSELTVQVRYSAATQPFIDSHASRQETVGSLRERVMAAFDVTDQQLPDGSSKIFFLYHENRKLENLNEILGDLTERERALKLKLVETVIQG
jgi:hypothetical protein